MVQPIQYQIPGALNPFENLVSGLKLGATMADMDAARAQQQAAVQLAQQKALAEQKAIARRQQYETGMSKVLANPNRTYADFEPLLAIAPDKDQLDAVQGMAKNADERLVKSQQLFTGNLLLALESKPEVAKRLLDERIAAEQDPQQKQLFKTIRDATEISPEKAAQLTELGGVSIFGDDWYKGIVNARKQRQTTALQPFELRTAIAKTEAEELAAALAKGTLPSNIATANSLAAKAATDAALAKGTLTSKIAEANSVAAKAATDAEKAAIEIQTLARIKNAELLKAQSDAEKAAIEAKFAARMAAADLKVKNNQAIASAASAKSSLASAGLSDQQRLKLVSEAERGPMPEFNSQLGGFVVPITAKNPSGGFIPLNEAVKAKDQQAAIKALKTAGYDPETGDDNITRLIKRSTGSTLGALTDIALRAVGVSDSGADAINALSSTANAIATDLLGGKLGAGISNADRDFIVGTLGDVANPYKTNDERLAGWNTAKNRMMLSGMIPPPTKVKPEGSFGEPSAPTVPNPARAAAVNSALEKYRTK